MENSTEQTDVKPKNKVQILCKKIADFLKKILKLIFLNPLLWAVLGFIVGGRLYEYGFFSLKGASVLVSGQCKTAQGVMRGDLVQDQIVVSSDSDVSLSGVLRKTREHITCLKKDVAIDKIGSVSDLFKSKIIAVPEIQKAVEVKNDTPDWMSYIGKEWSATGMCRDAKGVVLDPFKDRGITITNVRPSAEDKNTFYIYGIRDDKIAVVCDKKDISLQPMSPNSKKDDLNAVPKQEIASYIGQKIYVTSVCFPDARAYKMAGEVPPMKAFNLVKTPVEVIEEKVDPETNKLIKFAGNVLDRSETKSGIKLFGAKIVCDHASYPINYSESKDPNVEVEQQPSTNVDKK